MNGTDSVSFCVPGQPVGKGRPKFSLRNGYAHAYTPQKTHIYEELVAWEFQKKGKGFFLDKETPVRLEVNAFYAIPKSTSKISRSSMLSGELRPTKIPDVDNILKAICDGLNNVAFADDRQIVETSIKKYYSEDPRVEITVSKVKKEKGES